MMVGGMYTARGAITSPRSGVNCKLFLRQELHRGGVDHAGRDPRHAAMIERAGFFLARAAEDFDGDLPLFRVINLRPLWVRRAENGDDRHFECGGDR